MFFNQQAEHSRRDIFVRSWKWTTSLFFAALVYPFYRFIDFTTQSQPRYVKIQKRLQPGQFATEREFILFVDADTSWAVSRKCTHLGCRVHYLEQTKTIECPCHQSRFSQKGIRLSGPAKKNLPIFPVEELSGTDTGNDRENVGYIVTL